VNVPPLGVMTGVATDLLELDVVVALVGDAVTELVTGESAGFS
jgi:hypothetical protein